MSQENMFKNFEFVVHKTIGGMYRILLFGMEVEQCYSETDIEDIVYGFCLDWGIDYASAKIRRDYY